MGQFIHNRAIMKRRQDSKPPHSDAGALRRLSTCDIYIIPMLDDNYSYLIVDRDTRAAALVDPCDADEALEAARRVGVTITTLLITHNHVDHAGGNWQLKKHIPGLEVVGHKLEQVPGVTSKVVGGQIVRIGNTRIQVADTPFHTNHHGAYQYWRPLSVFSVLLPSEMLSAHDVQKCSEMSLQCHKNRSHSPCPALLTKAIHSPYYTTRVKLSQSPTSPPYKPTSQLAQRLHLLLVLPPLRE
eukprot:3314903-Pyramimonas_sp.AAC.3